MKKVFIALSTYNRKKITTLCLENLKKIVDKDSHSKIAIYDDASTSYDEKFLKNYSDVVLRFSRNGGIERSRARSFRDFEYIYKEYDLFYMTDNDTIHDPDFLKILREIYDRSSKDSKNKLITTTFELAQIVRSAIGKNPKLKIDPATKTFQALRIKVNNELTEIEKALKPLGY